MTFECLYCKRRTYIAAGHWKICTNCGDPIYLDWITKLSRILNAERIASENIKHKKKYGRPARPPNG